MRCHGSLNVCTFFTLPVLHFICKHDFSVFEILRMLEKQVITCSHPKNVVEANYILHCQHITIYIIHL